MKLQIEVERTFAGKQYENLKPKIVLSGDFNPEVGIDNEKIIHQLRNMTTALEEYGKEWQDDQLGKN